MMGSNQFFIFQKKHIFSKIKKPEVQRLKVTSQLMKKQQCKTFASLYGNILHLAMVEVHTDAIMALIQYYDPPLRCFTFKNFQLVPTIEEFERILRCPIGSRKPYMFSGHYSSMSRLALVLKVEEDELLKKKQNRNDVEGFPLSYLENMAQMRAAKEEWEVYMDILALMIYGMVLFPRCDQFVSLASIDAFIAFKYRKESPVVAVLADALHTLNVCFEKKSERLLCCLPVLFVWMVTNIFKQGGGTCCPIEDFKCHVIKDDFNWQSYLANMDETNVKWCPKWKNLTEMIWQCGDFPNVPLVGTRACINYNPVIGMRQHGYPIRGSPCKEITTPFLVPDLKNVEILTRVHRAWGRIGRKNMKCREKEDIRGDYRQWLKERVSIVGLPFPGEIKHVEEEGMERPMHIEELLRLRKALEEVEEEKRWIQEKLQETRKEKDKLQRENREMEQITGSALKKARIEERCNQMVRNVLKGKEKELEEKETERSLVWEENLYLKESLKNVQMAQQSLGKQLEEARQHMDDLVQEYEERIVKNRQDLASIYQEVLREEQGKLMEKKHEIQEKEEIIRDIQEECHVWKERFATMVRGGQYLPFILTRAEERADVFSTPTEIHQLFEYCNDMIELMKKIARQS